MLHAAVLALIVSADNYEFPKGIPFKAGDVEWYDSATTFQMADGVMHGYHPSSVRWGWNAERPWINGGLERSPNIKTYLFVKRAPGNPKEWQERSHFGNGGHYDRWSLPPGSTVGEMIVVGDYLTELGLIHITSGDPKFQTFRRFGPREDIAKWITKERVVPKTYKAHSVINVTGLSHEVELSREGIDEVRKLPFKDVTDVVFSEKSGLRAFAPTTSQRDSIVPINSDRGLFSTKECMACHRTAGTLGVRWDPNPVPSKYAGIRGSGFIFSLPRNIALRRSQRMP